MSFSRAGCASTSLLCAHSIRQLCSKHSGCRAIRSLVTLAIETSCDDTSVAVAETLSAGLSPVQVHFHGKVTANNDAYNGIHPLVALHSHQSSLASLVAKALAASPRPHLVAATRGPGMRSNLSVGLDTAKGIAVAYGLPFLGVHHMQAHALTPRLVSALTPSSNRPQTVQPEFPFLTVLVSGGHTLLIHSADLTEHTILAETQDIALGDCLDKAARAILPPGALKTPFGKALEDFAFPNAPGEYGYTPPTGRREELERRPTKWDWSLGPPLSQSKGGDKTSKRMMFSFAGLLSSVQRFMTRKASGAGTLTAEVRSPDYVSLEERRDMAREVQRLAFEHVASRIMLHLNSSQAMRYDSIVVSGGVASNSFFRHVLRSILDVRGYPHVDLVFPPVYLCTDNALMIAWAAMEMWHDGYQSSLDIGPVRKWSMDPKAEDGGILGVHGWMRSRG